MSNVIKAAFQTSGISLPAFPVSENKIQAVATLGSLQAIGVRRPSLSISAKDSSSSYAELRSLVNRRFDAARKKRAEGYARYIRQVELEKTRKGGTPAITLFSYDPITNFDQENNLVRFDYGSDLVALDGETQLEARFILLEQYAGDHSTRSQIMNLPFAVTIYHGFETDGAQQILSDYNSLATPIPATQALTYDHSTRLGIAINAVITASGIEQSVIQRQSATPNAGQKISMRQIIGLIVGLEGMYPECKTVDAASRKIRQQQLNIAEETISIATRLALSIASEANSALRKLNPDAIMILASQSRKMPHVIERIESNANMDDLLSIYKSKTLKSPEKRKAIESWCIG